MSKALLKIVFLLISVSAGLTQVIAQQNPAITSPANGATVAATGFTVTVTPSQIANSTVVIVYEDATNTWYSQSTYRTGTGSFTYNVPSGLKLNTRYRIQAISYTNAGVFSSQIFVTTNNIPPPVLTPVILSPANGATVATTGFTVTVKPSEIANSTTVIVYEDAPNTWYSQSTYRTGTGTFTYNVPSGLKSNTRYRIQAVSYTNAGVFSSQIIVVTNNIPPPVRTPIILSPANGTTVEPTGFTVTVKPSEIANSTVLVVYEASTNTWYSQSPFFSGTATFTYNVPSGLKPGTVYRLQAISYTNAGVFTSEILVATRDDFATEVLTYRENGTDKNFVKGAFRNSALQTFTVRAIPTATAYDWQFSKDSVNFSNPVTLTSTTNTLTFNATTSGFESGARYYVRARGRNGSRTGSYLLPGNPAIVNYYNPLFAPTATSPTTLNLDRRYFGVKATGVFNQTHLFFQIAKANPANDANPLADFVAGNYFVNGPNYTVSAIPSFALNNQAAVEQVTNPGGNLFLANSFKQYSWGAEAAFGVIEAQPQTIYRMRVIAARMVNGVFVQHTDLGVAGITTFGTNGIPDRVHNITNIAEGAVEVENRESLQYTRIAMTGLALFWDITQYQLQLSETPFVDNSDDQTKNGTIYSMGGVSQSSQIPFLIPGLKFFTRYYVRARSLATINGVANVASPWTDPVAGGLQEGISFTTKRMPAPTSLNVRDVATNRGAMFSVNQVVLADRYEWTLEKTSAPQTVYPAKVTNWTNATFNEYLERGASYRISVRTFASGQAPEASAYSLPITATFTVNATAARQGAEVAAAGSAQSEASVLFPNPFRQQSQLQLRAGYGQVQVKVVSATGQVVLSQEAAGGQTIPMGQHWPAGMYVVQILEPNGLRETFRLVKQ